MTRTFIESPNTQYEVFAPSGPDTEEFHGAFDTLDEARGCVKYDRLTNYSIWRGDQRIENGYSDLLDRAYAAGYAYACSYHD